MRHPTPRGGQDGSFRRDGKGFLTTMVTRMRVPPRHQTPDRPAVPSASGRPVPASLRVPMERYFGHDFSSIRIYADGEAERHGALAFARGAAIHLRHGAPDAATPEGRRLIGHELAHVVQQREGRVRAGTRANSIDDSVSLDDDADHHGHLAAGTDSGPRAARSLTRGRPEMTNPPIQRVVFKIDERGKVKYRPDDGFSAPPTGYERMADADFAIWKGAGKRRPSTKVMDSATGRRYVMTPHGLSRWKNKAVQPHKVMPPTAAVVNRTRTDRTSQLSPLMPFDVGPFEQQVTVANTTPHATTTYRPLPPAHAKLNWTGERDHVVSGESLNRRNPGDHGDAYQRGPTIAIDRWMHTKFSPTFGGRQQITDSVNGVAKKRVDVDKENPAVAFQRDVFEMLENTAGLDYSAGHKIAQPTLNLKQAPNRLRQMGAYRNLFRLNTRINAVDPNRGIDATESAFDYNLATVGKKKTKVNALVPTAPATTQGSVIRDKFIDRLRAEHFLL